VCKNLSAIIEEHKEARICFPLAYNASMLLRPPWRAETRKRDPMSNHNSSIDNISKSGNMKPENNGCCVRSRLWAMSAVLISAEFVSYAGVVATFLFAVPISVKIMVSFNNATHIQRNAATRQSEML